MDGFAVKYCKGVSKWKIIGEISAGKFKNYEPEANEAVMIMTGSRMPEKADTVLPIEHVTVNADEIILNIGYALNKYQYVRKSGEDIRKSERVLCKGQIIHPNHIQLIANCGKEYIKVFSKLKTGVLSTGNELIEINRKPKGDKIRASNLYSLMSAAVQCGFRYVNFGIIKDEQHVLKRKINNALNSDIDILLTSGGVSEGKYDYLPDIYNELGVKTLFHKVNIKPGKPLLFGVFNKNSKRILVFGLPGNSVSCYVNFILFVRDIYYSTKFNDSLFNVNAVLLKDIKKTDDKRHFIRGILKETGGINYADVSGSQSSANSLGLSKSNVLIEFPEEIKELKAGSVVECIKI
jgi:molybdopterin molybdotransferase